MCRSEDGLCGRGVKCHSFCQNDAGRERERERERKVFISIPGRGKHKNLCSIREPSDIVSFRRAVKNSGFVRLIITI